MIKFLMSYMLKCRKKQHFADYFFKFNTADLLNTTKFAEKMFYNAKILMEGGRHY